jgi:hypothetical protein
MKGIGNEFERLKKLKLIYYSINFPEAYMYLTNQANQMELTDLRFLESAPTNLKV